MKRVRIGAGAGFSDDRIEPAHDLVRDGDLDYLVFECLAERSIAVAQLERQHVPDAGYNEWIEERFRAVLVPAAARGTRIITNMGAANPIAAARIVARLAGELGLPELTIVAVTGDDVLAVTAVEAREAVPLGASVISANVYLGIEPLLEALRLGADIVITGRVADPSLFLAPLVHEFGWRLDDWGMLGKGTAVGHLLECAGQVTGGYFAEPGVKDVPGLSSLGLPLAEVAETGDFVITKVANTGGVVSVATVTEQLLYEVHDPSAYLTPDVTADFSGAHLEQLGPDRIAVSGIGGHPRPDMLKASVGYLDSWVGEGEISYAGPNALERGRLALEIVRERLELLEITPLDSRFELIGVDAVHRGIDVPSGAAPDEVRVRVAARTSDADTARRVGHEVTALWLNGPAGGSGARRGVRQDVGIASTFVPRDLVETRLHVMNGWADDAAA
jgi:Acyclic terpene utilisation family protein AtuA